jgi:hypothetical protein
MTLKPTKKSRRIACPELLTTEGAILTQQVVELSNGKVERYYPLERELPFTEWISNRLSLKSNHDGELTLWNADEPMI